jgi:hypothetical protein
MENESRVVLLIVAILLGAGIPIQGRAETPPAGIIRSSMEFPPPRSPRTMPGIGEILGGFHGLYAASFMGPRISGGPRETYNVFLGDSASMQVFHSFQLGYEVNERLRMGFGADLAQTLYDGVQGDSGAVRRRSSDWFDPYVFFQFPDLIRVPGWSVFTAASLSLPMTRNSVDSLRITSLTLQQSWNLNSGGPWRFGVNFFLNPVLLGYPAPERFPRRRTFYASVGPNFGFALSNEWTIGIGTNFNFDHTSPDPEGSFHFDPAISDFAQLTLAYSKTIGSVTAGISTYYQSLIGNPSPSTSIVGAGFSIAF